MGRLSHILSFVACNPALANPLGSFHIFLHVSSIAASILLIVVGERAIRQCVCIILELAPYRSNICLIPAGSGAASTAVVMFVMVSSVHERCAIGLREAVRDVPRYLPGRGSSWEMAVMGVPRIVTWARRAIRASSRSFFVFSF